MIRWIMRSLCVHRPKRIERGWLLMKVCRDCGTANHDFNLYCKKCTASLYRRITSNNVASPLFFRRPTDRVARA